MTTIGHNGVNSEHLRAFIERIENLEEAKAAIAEDIKEVYSEAKGAGYDVKMMRKVVSLRKMDAAKRAEEQAILDLYLEALGDLKDLPLGQAAVAREFGGRG